jgi:hypothetical protein
MATPNTSQEKTMKLAQTLKIWMLKCEYANHMVDAYLAEQRGDMPFRADCLSRAHEVQRRLFVEELNYAR